MASLHDQADPLQQCGYCLGYSQGELWARIELIGDESRGVTIRCRECGYQGIDLAYLGCADVDVHRVMNVAELLDVGEQHVINVHAS